MSPRSKRIVLVAGALLAAFAVLLWVQRSGSRARHEPAATSPAARGGPQLASLGGPASPGRGELATLELGGAPSSARLRMQYESYKQSSIYPDWSYPLTPDMEFLLAWNAPVTNDLPFDDAHQIRIRFDAQKGRVFAGEPYLSWIEAWTEEKGVRTSLPVHVVKASVMITSGPAMGEAFELAYHDDGRDGDVQAGDHRFTSRFVPSERHELSRATQGRIEAYVQIAGQTRLFLRDFVFSPRPVLEVVEVRDELQGGSLVVTLVCDVLEDGVYTFYGNLMAADGTTPIAMSKRSYPLKAGRTTADLVFFGKVLNDGGIDGPYLVRDLHGLKRQSEDEFNVWWSHPATHTTRAYQAGDFSDAEWDDPEKRERLAHFERLLQEEDARAGGAGSPR